jgi:hypothetical protein
LGEEGSLPRYIKQWLLILQNCISAVFVVRPLIPCPDTSQDLSSFKNGNTIKDFRNKYIFLWLFLFFKE